MFDIMFHVWTRFYIFAKVVQELYGLKKIDNYLDDFFLAEMSDIECSNNMFKFKTICKRLGVPIADEKIECHFTSMKAKLPHNDCNWFKVTFFFKFTFI
jgi:hypothetical protein